jgi:hypothetical protein
MLSLRIWPVRRPSPDAGLPWTGLLSPNKPLFSITYLGYVIVLLTTENGLRQASSHFSWFIVGFIWQFGKEDAWARSFAVGMTNICCQEKWGICWIPCTSDV